MAEIQGKWILVLVTEGSSYWELTVPSRVRSSTAFVKHLVCDGMHQLSNCEQLNNKSYSDCITIIHYAWLHENCSKLGHMAKGCMHGVDGPAHYSQNFFVNNRAL